MTEPTTDIPTAEILDLTPARGGSYLLAARCPHGARVVHGAGFDLAVVADFLGHRSSAVDCCKPLGYELVDGDDLLPARIADLAAEANEATTRRASRWSRWA